MYRTDAGELLDLVATRYTACHQNIAGPEGSGGGQQPALADGS